MIENEQREIQLSQAACRVAQMAHEMADAARVTLTDLHWHRGHEVANLDHRRLTLQSLTGAMTEHFPDEWLEALGGSGDDPRIERCLSGMIQALAAPPAR